MLLGRGCGSVPCSAGSLSFWVMPMPMLLRLLDRDGAGVEDGETRVVMILREFMLRSTSKPWDTAPGVGERQSNDEGGEGGSGARQG
jgi:hypothetical protein